MHFFNAIITHKDWTILKQLERETVLLVLLDTIEFLKYNKNKIKNDQQPISTRRTRLHRFTHRDRNLQKNESKHHHCG